MTFPSYSAPICSCILFDAAGYMAREMGVPLELVAAVNPNDIVHRMLLTGHFSLRNRTSLKY
jgi:hypothetical protein